MKSHASVTVKAGIYHAVKRLRHGLAHLPSLDREPLKGAIQDPT